jgi:hypothetical protein
MYFKTYGYIAVYQALYFANDLKLAHYIKIPPRHTFYAQLYGQRQHLQLCHGLPGRLHAGRCFQVHLPEPAHILHRCHLLGHAQS